MHDLNLLMQHYSIRISFRFESGAPKGLLSPRAWAVQFCVARMWSRLGFSSLVSSVVYCSPTAKAVPAPSRVEGKLYELFHSPQIFWSSSSISIPQLKRSSRHHPFTLTPFTSHKKHSFSLLLPPSRLQILIKSITMHFTKAFTLAAIVLAGAAFAAPSPPMPAKPVSPTIKQRSPCSDPGGIQVCCNGGLLGCLVQGKVPLSEVISWASIFWGTWILNYQPAECILVIGSRCSGTAYCCSNKVGSPRNGLIDVVSIR